MLFRVVTWDAVSVATGVDTVGLDTMSPQSSSSSTSGGADSFDEVSISRVSRPAHGSNEVTGGWDGGAEIEFEAAGVSDVDGTGRFWVTGSNSCRVRFGETMRSCGVCTLSIVAWVDPIGETMEFRLGLSCFQGSTETAGELQLNAAGALVVRGGRLCLTGAGAR